VVRRGKDERNGTVLKGRGAKRPEWWRGRVCRPGEFRQSVTMKLLKRQLQFARTGRKWKKKKDDAVVDLQLISEGKKKRGNRHRSHSKKEEKPHNRRRKGVIAKHHFPEKERRDTWTDTKREE